MKANNFVLSSDDINLHSKLTDALADAVLTVKRNAQKFSEGTTYPVEYKDGAYGKTYNGGPGGGCWTEGFWPGQIWLAYEVCGDEILKSLGEKHVEDFNNRVEENFNVDWHHDTGFLYSLSCVSAYKLTGSELAKKAALTAAYSLSRRFRKRGGFIQSMSDSYDAENYKFIIDTMMNLPLLFWASKETGNSEYARKATTHAETTRKYIIRDDGSTYHHFLMDNVSGNPKRGLTLQGAHDESCWSRGQAWMIYGSALMYGVTGDTSWIDTFKTVADYFIEHLPDDYVPHWDFSVLGTDDDDRDSSAAAIAACGIMELANLISPSSIEKYINVAKKMTESLADNYAIPHSNGEDGLLAYTMASKPHGMIRKCETYGDYFYMEALIRATRSWNKYW